jgi:hypothetical protein
LYPRGNPMRKWTTVLVVLACLTLKVTSSEASTPGTGTAPSPLSTLSAGRAAAQIELGNLYRKERRYPDAYAAYARVLQSDDPKLRDSALRAIKHTLQEERDYGFWARWNGPRLIEKGLEYGTVILAVGALLLAAWRVAGWVGTIRGAKSCVILATENGDPHLAEVFRMAYLKMIGSQARRREASGPIGIVPVTPTLDAATDELLPQLESLVSENAGRIATMIMGRLMQPQYRLSIGKVNERFQTHLVVSLEAKGKIVEVWDERIAVADLFDADCRFLREIVAYVDGYVTANNR